MAYNKTNWKDRIVEKPRTYKIQNNSDGTITLVPMEGTVVEAGTPINAFNMNHIEDGIEALELEKASKDIYGDEGIKELGKVITNSDGYAQFIVENAQTKARLIVGTGGNSYLQASGPGKVDSGGTLHIGGYNSSQLEKMMISTKYLENNAWTIFYSYNDKYVGILNKSANQYFKLFNDGKVSYGGGSIPVVTKPAFEQSVSLGVNKVVTVTHNLGYKPLTEVCMTLGNVNVTWQHLDNNNIRLYNYSAGNEATAYIRCW